MHPDQAGKVMAEKIVLTREDVARAKVYVLKETTTNVMDMADRWVEAQGGTTDRTVNTMSPEVQERLDKVSQSFSLRFAFYQAVNELVAIGDLFPAAGLAVCEVRLTNKTPHFVDGIAVPLSCPYYPHVLRPFPMSGPPADVDLLLADAGCGTLHRGIVEAVKQSLGCYRRGFYLPAIAMLAAAAEAEWAECGRAVAAKFTNAKLDALIPDPNVGMGNKVSQVRKSLEHGDAKPLLKAAGVTIHSVNDAELWTTELRERRNALH